MKIKRRLRNNMELIVIILTVSIITILKINHRPYLTAIIKALIIAIALIILIIISQEAGSSSHSSPMHGGGSGGAPASQQGPSGSGSETPTMFPYPGRATPHQQQHHHEQRECSGFWNL